MTVQHDYEKQPEKGMLNEPAFYYFFHKAIFYENILKSSLKIINYDNSKILHDKPSFLHDNLQIYQRTRVFDGSS